MEQQLGLNIVLNDEFTFQNFLKEENIILYDNLFASISFKPNSERIFYLWGASGSGKSHLLKASCHYLGNQPCAYIPLKQFKTASPDILENLEQLSLVAIDDLDEIAQNPIWEESLFHLYNKIFLNEKTRLLITGKQPIASMNIHLPDFRSRLSAGMVFHLVMLEEQNRIKLLQQKAEKRGLFLPGEVAHFLMSRCPRNTGELISILDQLDKAAWIAKHRLTIPFVKKTLSL